MKVLLVYPRWNYPTFGQLQEPLGLLYLAAVLKEAGHEATVVDLAIAEIERVDEAAAAADLLGISSSTVLFAAPSKSSSGSRRAGPICRRPRRSTHRPAREAVRAGFDAAAVARARTRWSSFAPRSRPAGRFIKCRAWSRGTGPRSRPVRRGPSSRPRPSARRRRTRVDYSAYFAKNLSTSG